MVYSFDGYNYLIRLDKGERIVESLIRFSKEKNIRGAWVSGIGGVTSAEIGFYDLAAKEYHWQTFERPMEINSLSGTVAWADDEVTPHLHISLGDVKMNVIGGHLKEAVVGGTCELFVHVWNHNDLTRVTDTSTGLRLLQIPK